MYERKRQENAGNGKRWREKGEEKVGLRAIDDLRGR
jgi:hypothetical protein